MRKSKQIHHSILLICEGDNTEPLYFKSIRKVIQEKQIWGNNFSLIIIPKIHDEDEEDDQIGFPSHKTTRPSKEIKNSGKRIDGEVEKEFTPLPTKYVREAQLEMNDKSYSEAWAIFDHDSRRDDHLKAVFDLAKDEDKGIVRIAFSNKAFEHWYLLHFEQNSTAFNKSECREGKEPLECGTGKHTDDCWGSSCICGYLRIMRYLEVSTKDKVYFYPILEPRMEQAFINASWLRFHMRSLSVTSTANYRTNPYTDVDELVKYLLKDSTEHIWGSMNTEIGIEGISMLLNVEVGDLFIVNMGKASFIIGDNAKLLNRDFAPIFPFIRSDVQPGKSTKISLAALSGPEYFSIRINNKILFVAINS